MVQFARSKEARTFMQYAIKFFFNHTDFLTEAAYYRNAAVAATMPPLMHSCNCDDGNEVQSPSGHPFPSFMVLERGVTLQEACFQLQHHMQCTLTMYACAHLRFGKRVKDMVLLAAE